jgi:hypothetical protein
MTWFRLQVKVNNIRLFMVESRFTTETKTKSSEEDQFSMEE